MISYFFTTPSMGEKGNSYENAFAESLIKTIKYEEVYMNEYNTMDDVCCNIEQFIKEVYNKKRLTAALAISRQLNLKRGFK